MASTLLYPTGTLQLFDGTSIVGTAGPASVWTDDDDATYATVPDGGNNILCTLDHFGGGPVISVVVHGRASAVRDPFAFPTTTFTPQFQIHPADDLSIGAVFAQGVGEDLFPNDGSIHDFLVVSDPVDDPTAIAAALASDAYLELYSSFEILTVYEAWVEIITRSSPTRRKYPNPTGQGVGPTRHWPRPRRGVTGIN